MSYKINQLIEVRRDIEVYREVSSGSYLFVFCSTKKNGNPHNIGVIWRRNITTIEDCLLPIKEVSDLEFEKLIADKVNKANNKANKKGD